MLTPAAAVYLANVVADRIDANRLAAGAREMPTRRMPRGTRSDRTPTRRRILVLRARSA
jgi:hypothetical protein